jgi:phage-related minor tail protein
VGAANALLHNSNASAAAMGVIGNMNKYSNNKEVESRPATFTLPTGHVTYASKRL